MKQGAFSDLFGTAFKLTFILCVFGSVTHAHDSSPTVSAKISCPTAGTKFDAGDNILISYNIYENGYHDVKYASLYLRKDKCDDGYNNNNEDQNDKYDNNQYQSYGGGSSTSVVCANDCFWKGRWGIPIKDPAAVDSSVVSYYWRIPTGIAQGRYYIELVVKLDDGGSDSIVVDTPIYIYQNCDCEGISAAARLKIGFDKTEVMAVSTFVFLGGILLV
ncbi:hypothetical protein BZG36_01586 [Bifiguratus adelaidae]|uniref:Reelin domain-containing protein n=1 Tax=Bifiguratus adelaidae TaxID=1938954 RepID=A0A261Y414_9FUNG|nr:hypothetical protein BZG36_01586 [Bifiguratus adelaidae]